MKLTFKFWENEHDSRNGKLVPTLVIERDGEELFLQPFRYYRMQVSGSIKQNGCYGESEVLGLLRLAMFASTEEKIFPEALKQMDGFQKNVPLLYGLIDQLSKVAMIEEFDSDEIDIIYRSSEYDKFIKETCNYLHNRLNAMRLIGAVLKTRKNPDNCENCFDAFRV